MALQYETYPAVDIRPLTVPLDVKDRLTHAIASKMLDEEAFDDKEDPQNVLANAYAVAQATLTSKLSKYLQLHALRNIRANQTIMRLHGDLVRIDDTERIAKLDDASKNTNKLKIHVIPDTLMLYSYRPRPDTIEIWPYEPVFGTSPNAKIALRNNSSEVWLISTRDIRPNEPIAAPSPPTLED